MRGSVRRNNSACLTIGEGSPWREVVDEYTGASDQFHERHYNEFVTFLPYVQRFLDLIKDEPWVFGIPVGGERSFLSEVGLELREVLAIGSEESIKRYATKADGTQLGAQAMAEGMARMAQRAREAGAASPEARAIDPERMREQQRTMAYQLAEAVVR